MKSNVYRHPLLGLVVLLLCVSLFSFACGDDDDDDDDDNDTAPTDDDATDDDATDDDATDDDATDDDDDDNDDDDDDDDNDDDDDDDDNDDDDDDVTPVTGCDIGDYDPYYGVLHCHTGYSDGEEIPEVAFAYARDVAGLDILIVTDHLEQLYLPFPTADKWAKCRQQADAAYEPGTYLTDCGFEYGSGFILPWFQSTGHNNVFFSEELFPIVQLDFLNFYDTLVEHPGTVGQFNHPRSDPYQDWNHFEYYEDVDVQMNLFEFNGTDFAWEAFVEALDAGWHVSPMNNQDNHGPDWGTKNDKRSVLLMGELTREELYDSMMSRRTFQTYDKNAYIKASTDDGCWMGSILPIATDVTLNVEAFDPDGGDGFAVITVYGPGETFLAEVDCGGATSCSDSIELPVGDQTYFVVTATQSDGDLLVAAPIWFE